MGERTIGILPVFVTQVALQLALALILAGILGAFHRLYRHAYLRDWSLSWLALAVYVAVSAVGGTTTGGGLTAARVGALSISLVAAYLQVAWLLLGARGLAGEKEIPAATRRLALAVAIAAGLASTGLAAAGMSHPSPVGLRCLVAGLAYLAAAAAILTRRQPGARLGRTFAGLALVVYAADQLAYFAIGFVPQGRQLQPLLVLMSFDLLATAVIGLALVAWPLEGEHERQRQVADLARRRERAQACAYRVSEAARTVSDLDALFRSLHESLVEVVPARNFYVAFYDAAAGTLSFPYFADERDPPPGPKPLGRGLTECVLRSGQPLLATSRGVPRARGPRGGGAHRQRLRRLAGSAALRPRRGDRHGGDPDLRPRRAARARGPRAVRLRVRADRGGDQGAARRGRAARADRPHRRRAPTRGRGAPRARGRPRRASRRQAEAQPRGVPDRRFGPGALAADHQDPVRLLRQRASGRAGRGDRRHGAARGGGGAAPRGQGREPERPGGGCRPRLQQPARRDPGARRAGACAAAAGQRRARARREGGERRRARRRPHAPDARLLGARALRGAAHGRSCARAREPAPAGGRAAEERAARGELRSLAAGGGRRRGPAAAGADEPDHQRGRGDRRAWWNGDGRDRRPRRRGQRRRAVARERPAARPRPLRLARGGGRRPGHGSRDGGPHLRAVLHDQVHRARAGAGRGAGCRARTPRRGECAERAGQGHRVPAAARSERARGRARNGRAPGPGPARRDRAGDRRRARGAPDGGRNPGARGVRGASSRGRRVGNSALPRPPRAGGRRGARCRA